jgi:protoporphyrin/coproporphyrin ferrochelatase
MVPYDALLIVSFGGPEGPDDVMPFLENVLRGRNVPPDRLMQVAEHYHRFGGVSPINAQCRALIAALQAELSVRGPRLPIYWGNRNWHPLLPDTLRRMADEGVRRALAFFTSPFSSYSGCRQYRENILRAQEGLGPSAPRIDKLRAFYNHPGFIEPNARNVRAALETIPSDRRERAALVFTAHSIPLAMAAGCAYEAQLREACRLVGERVGRSEGALVFQSRSGPPSVPWLEPDILEHLGSLRAQRVRDVVVAPIGFISDHMEVLYDLDTEAAARAKALDLHLVRASTVGVTPEFVSMIRDLVLERLEDRAERRALGERGPVPDLCPDDCCPPGAPGRPSART